MSMFDDRRSTDEFDFLAAYLEHYGMATLTPFLKQKEREEVSEIAAYFENAEAQDEYGHRRAS